MGSVKASSTDYNESNKPNLKSLARIGSEKSFVELGAPNNEHFYRSISTAPPRRVGWSSMIPNVCA